MGDNVILCLLRTAQGVRDKMLSLESCQSQIGYQVFVWWDYGLSDDKNSAIRHNNIYREIKVGNVFCYVVFFIYSFMYYYYYYNVK